MSKRIKVGKISGVHGLKGDVKVTSYSGVDDLIDIFEGHSKGGLDVFLIPSSKKTDFKEKVFKIESFKKHQSVVLVKFVGVIDRDGSEALKGMELEVLRDKLPNLSEGEFYLHDLVGLEAIGQDGESFGKLKDIINAGAGDVYIIEGGPGGEILLPANEETVLEINIKEGFIKVRIPDGLIPEPDSDTV